MASVLPRVEKLNEDKRVESLLVFRLDEGSMPSGSTKRTSAKLAKSSLADVLHIIKPAPTLRLLMHSQLKQESGNIHLNGLGLTG